MGLGLQQPVRPAPAFKKERRSPRSQSVRRRRDITRMIERRSFAEKVAIRTFCAVQAALILIALGSLLTDRTPSHAGARPLAAAIASAE